MSIKYHAKGFTDKQPKPRKKDPLVELQKQLRREEVNLKLQKRLEKSILTEKDIPSNDIVFSL